MPDKKDDSKEQKFYASAIKEYAKLEKENSQKANVMQKAYEAAVTELGYSDKELADSGKAKAVAKLMFSDKYLGNAEFNPLLRGDFYKDFAKKSDAEKSADYRHMLDMDLQNIVSNKNLMDRFNRAQFAGAMAQHYGGLTAHQMKSLTWNRIYDSGKTLDQNMKAYADVLNQDPILSGSGRSVNPYKFDSVDDIATALTASLAGQSSREDYQYAHGVGF